jgi:hypothetical protein
MMPSLNHVAFPSLRAAWALPLLLVLACGGSAPPPPEATPVPAVAADGVLNVSLVQDGAAPGFSALNLVIQGVEVQVGGVWRAVPLDGASSGPQPVDLLGATSASPCALGTKVPWPAGANTQVRLTFGPGSTATPVGGGPAQNLIMLPELLGPMALPGSFAVAPGQVKDLVVAVAVANTVLPDPSDPTRYRFKPTALRGYDRSATGAISGGIAAAPPEAAGGDAAATPTPLGGVTVTAQLQQLSSQEGNALVFRTAQTDDAGNFTLDLLPLGYTWCAVSQPVAGAQAYGAAASAGAPLGLAPFALAVRELTPPPVAATGTLQGILVGPYAADQVNVVDLVQTFPAGGNPYTFTVRSAAVAPLPGTPAPAGTFLFEGVPPGTYQAVLNRYGYVDGVGATRQRYPTASFEIKAGATVSIQF